MTISNSLAASEAECAAGRTAPRVSLADIEANIAGYNHFTARDACDALGQPSPESFAVLSICLVNTRNGFTIVGKSAPASVENFDAELGHKLAYEDAVRQLWPLMGYALREQLADAV